MSRNSDADQSGGSYFMRVFACIVGVVSASVAYRVSHDAVGSLFRKDSPAEVTVAPSGPPPRRASSLNPPPVAPPVAPPIAPPQFTPPVRPPLRPPIEPKQEEPRPETITTQPFTIDPQAKAAGKTLYLSVLTPFAYQAGPWKLGIGTKGDDGKSPIMLQKKEYKYGISMHPPQTGVCRVSFVPGKEFTRFKGSAGIGDGMNPFGTVVFAIYGDGRKLWESIGVPKAGTAVQFAEDVTGVEVLTLETRMKDGNHHAAHAVWLDPWLER